MTCKTVDAPSSIWRIGRSPDPLSTGLLLSREELNSPHAGSRFDDPLGAYLVLYFGTDLKCCYVETLSRFRPDPEVVAFIKDEWESAGHPVIGGVPAEWRFKRAAVHVDLTGTLPFLDLTATETQQYLRTEMAEALTLFGYKDLDAAVILGNDRRITRWISRWAYNAMDENGDYIYGGIKYSSRLGTAHICWAVFEDRAFIAELEIQPIFRADAVMQEVAGTFGLNVF